MPEDRDDQSGDPGTLPPHYPPGYPPPPGMEPTYQAPPPWSPPAGAAPGSSPFAAPPGPAFGSPAGAVFGPPPGASVFGPPGMVNGAGHESTTRHPGRRRVVVTALVCVLIVGLVAAITGVVVSGPATSTTSATTVPPVSPAARQLLQSSLAAARASGSFHYVATSRSSGASGGSQKTVGLAGPDSGQQNITVGSQKFTVLVVGKTAFIEGNAAALVSNLELSDTVATAHAGQWISLSPGDQPYASVYAAVTAPSALADNVTVVPQTQLPASTVDSRRVVTVSGAIAKVRIAGQTIAEKGTATLAVRASAPHLPVRYHEQGTYQGQATVSTVTFSHWGIPVSVAAPTNSVPFASLPQGSGSTPTTPRGTVVA
ncbi:MAG: hypothetical protein ACRDY1_06060 [Acidimicrobiales bacterium]